MDTQATLTQSQYLKFRSVFAKVIRFSQTNAKDLSYLFSGVSTLCGIHMMTPF